MLKENLSCSLATICIQGAVKRRSRSNSTTWALYKIWTGYFEKRAAVFPILTGEGKIDNERLEKSDRNNAKTTLSMMYSEEQSTGSWEYLVHMSTLSSYDGEVGDEMDKMRWPRTLQLTWITVQMANICPSDGAMSLGEVIPLKCCGGGKKLQPHDSSCFNQGAWPNLERPQISVAWKSITTVRLAGDSRAQFLIKVVQMLSELVAELSDESVGCRLLTLNWKGT